MTVPVTKGRARCRNSASRTKLRLGAVLVGLVAWVYPSAALAHSSFGGHAYGNSGGWFQEYGSGVNIQVPRVGNHTVVAHEFELSRAVAQTSGGQLVQSGLIRTGSSIALDNCGQSVGAYSYYEEWRLPGQGYTCSMGGVAQTLENDEYYVSNYQLAGSGIWLLHTIGANINYASYRNLGSNTATPMYGEELNNDVGTQCQASSSTTAGFYGQGSGNFGPARWFVFFGPNRGTPNPIVNPNNTVYMYPTDFGLWSVPSVTSWPQSISHQGSTACNPS